MLPEAHLTSHSRMSGSRWVIKPSWLSGSWRSFLYGSSVYSCYLFLISSASVRSIPFFVLYCAHLCMKCSLGISNFLEEIASLSLSIVFLYFFALVTEEGFLNLSLLVFGTLHSVSFSSLHITKTKGEHLPWVLDSAPNHWYDNHWYDYQWQMHLSRTCVGAALDFSHCGWESCREPRKKILRVGAGDRPMFLYHYSSRDSKCCI